MKFRGWRSLAITLIAAPAITIQLPAQDKPDHKPTHHQYKLYDLGTFGGPNSYPSFGAITLTPTGATGAGDTPVPDPYNPNCLTDCFVKHAFRWQGGALTDLGALPGNNGGNSSYGFAINNSGLVAGISENGSIDPDTGYPEVNAVVWQRGSMANLGTFGGTQSSAEMMNNRGQVVGVATNAIPDPFSLGGDPFPATTQSRAFLWERGVMRDLGTLGGPDAFGRLISQSGLVAGWSYINSIPNPTTGIPTIDPFLWKNGKMIDLGSLGGTSGFPQWVNNRGQVVGYSNLAGDQFQHAFVWENGVLTDLGTLGGDFSFALWNNDAGDIVGVAALPGDGAFPAALWSHGAITNLGTLPGDNLANARSINSAKQIVGISCLLPCNTHRGFLWEGRGPMVDLNALVQPPSNIVVTDPNQIDDRGEIAAQGMLPNGDTHAVVLIPDGDCDSACEQRVAASQNATRVSQSATTGAAPPAFGRLADWLTNPLGQHKGTLAQRRVPLN